MAAAIGLDVHVLAERALRALAPDVEVLKEHRDLISRTVQQIDRNLI